MKIAMYNVTTTVNLGGVETVVWEVSRELGRRGHEVHVVGGEGAIRKEYEGVRVVTFPYRPRNRFPALGNRYRKFAERMSFAHSALPFMEHERYDIVVIFKPYDMPWAWQLKKKTGSRVIMASQGTDFFPGDRWFGARMDGFTSCSRYNGDLIEEHFGRPVAVIYNGFNEELFKPLPPDTALRNNLGLGEDDRVIIYAGRLVRLKGVHKLLEAFGTVVEKIDARLVIIGDGAERGPLEEAATAMGIRQKVIFTGSVANHELPRYYSLAHAAVLPTMTEEAFGISIAEAMACGVPVVATRVGGIPEIALEQLLVTPSSSPEIAEKLFLLLSNESWHSTISDQCRERIREFTWARVADRLLEYCTSFES